MSVGGERLDGSPFQGDWVLTVGEVQNWIDRAAPGDRLRYGGGLSLVRGETSRYVVSLAIAGLADPFQPRSKERPGFDFIIQKRTPPPGPRHARPPEEDKALDVILRSLKRAANFGLRAPTNAELAREAGLPGTGAVAWRITRLIEAGLIKTQAITTGPEAGWRVVTICETGQQTKVPPSWERARAQARQEKVK